MGRAEEIEARQKDLYDGPFVTRGQKATLRAYDKFYDMLPSFLDVFPDEDAFLNFAFYFVMCTIVTAFILARFVKIQPSGFL